METYVIGESMDEYFVAWSSATIKGIPIDDVLAPDVENRSELAHSLKLEGQRIIKAKGAVTFGIASAVLSICSTILFDKRKTLPLSHYQPEMGCCLSLPVVLGRNGIIETIPISLNKVEQIHFTATGRELREEVERVQSQLLSIA